MATYLRPSVVQHYLRPQITLRSGNNNLDQVITDVLPMFHYGEVVVSAIIYMYVYNKSSDIYVLFFLGNFTI